MPMKIRNDKGEWVFIDPTTKWQTTKVGGDTNPEFDPNFHVRTKKVD